MMLIGEYLEQMAERLEQAQVYLGHGTDNYWDEAVALLLHGIGEDYDAGREILQRSLSEAQQTVLEGVLQQRIEQRLPTPYITGKAWFAGLCFAVQPGVLIPRSPIAELIEAGFSPWVLSEPKAVLDLCCGGGCIGIASAYYLPEAQVDLVDIAPEALALAEQNVAAFDLQGSCRVLDSDLFNGLEPGTSYDVIVSNPPYVDAEDMANLPAEYRHEPALALEAGSDGLDLVRRILREASTYLAAQGILIVEVGNSQPALEAAFPSVPFTWLEFARGGEGVFLLTKEQLQAHAGDFAV